MSFDQDTPLNRVANETIKANTALMDYWLMGAGRSLEKPVWARAADIKCQGMSGGRRDS